MLVELKTRRRWIVSILETVADQSEERLIARATVKHSTTRSYVSGELNLASRLKAATRPLSSTGR